MSDGFQVTMTGLQQAAGVFRAEAGTFAAIMPSRGPASVDGGSAEINDALSLVLGAIGGLHTQLAGVIDQHGGKLEAAYGTYRDAEDANVTMNEAITTGLGPG
jgi:Family of unknown function (DUF6317)